MLSSNIESDRSFARRIGTVITVIGADSLCVFFVLFSLFFELCIRWSFQVEGFGVLFLVLCGLCGWWVEVRLLDRVW